MKRIICEDTNEIFDDYKKYLQSKHWKNVKRRFKESKLGKCCYICEGYYKLNLHHKTYKRIGKEKLNDLIYLCQSCHNNVHYELNNSTSINTNLWNIAKKIKKRNKSMYRE